MTYGAAAMVNDSGNGVGVQMHPYDYACKTMLTEKGDQKSQADSCSHPHGITEVGLTGLG